MEAIFGAMILEAIVMDAIDAIGDEGSGDGLGEDGIDS